MKKKKRIIIKNNNRTLNKEYIKLQKNIIKNNTNLILPNNIDSDDKINIKTNSWFDMKLNNINISKIPKLDYKLFTENNKNEFIISQKIYLDLTNEQKHILKMWFKSNDKMYNETLKFLKFNSKNFEEEYDKNENIKVYFNLYSKIKKIENLNKSILKNLDKNNLELDLKLEYENNNKELLNLNNDINTIKSILNIELKNKPYCLSNTFKFNFCNIRTYYLKDIRNSIIKECKSNILDKNINIKTHILDTAIKVACTNYSTAINKFNDKKIKHFRIRYWKEKRESRILEIEPTYFRNNTLCDSIFGKIKGYIITNNKKINFNFNNINKTSKLQYNKKTKEYIVFNSISTEVINNEQNKNLIGIDLGLRTFATCLSENETIEINNNVNSRLKKLIQKKLNLKKLKYTRKNKILLFKINKRIKGLTDELHWKTIKFLTDNYKTILVGDLSTKGIVSNNSSVLTKYNKELSYALSFYRFRQRLEFKCNLKKCNYLKVNEYYTSKMCSVCSNYKEDLGSNKVYNCSKCNTIMDRDINGCRNIIFKCCL